MEAQEQVRAAVSALDRAAEKGILHPNNARRRKSRLAVMASRLARAGEGEGGEKAAVRSAAAGGAKGRARATGGRKAAAKPAASAKSPAKPAARGAASAPAKASRSARPARTEQ